MINQPNIARPGSRSIAKSAIGRGFRKGKSTGIGIKKTASLTNQSQCLDGGDQGGDDPWHDEPEHLAAGPNEPIRGRNEEMVSCTLSVINIWVILIICYHLKVKRRDKLLN